jgi:hypothetical protein
LNYTSESAAESLTSIPGAAPEVDARHSCGRYLTLQEAVRGVDERGELESFVGAAFERKHAAIVRSFMPTLLAFRDPVGRLRGVTGLRAAGAERLFLEQYLDIPIESAIAASSGLHVRREEIVEVGNLAGANCRTAVRMVAQLPRYLLSRDFRWIVFTATSAVRKILLGFGAPLFELARADGTRVTGGDDAWGSYYQADPRVFVGHLPDSGRIAAFDQGDRGH